MGTRSGRGSLWNKWDLHVHTPATLANNNYGGNVDAAWEEFFRDIEALPSSFKVIGINDYLFIDGYKRVIAAHDAGRMQNIDCFLPVVELRIAAFGGNKSFSRINFHVVLSDEIGTDVIDAQFLKGLPRHYKIVAKHENARGDWQALATMESLEDLGRRVLEQIPAAQRKNAPSPLTMGFNSLNFDLKDVLELLKSHYFEGRHLTAVGKTEWEDIRWTGSVADKKHIISIADLVFVSAADPAAWERGARSLREQGVHPRLLDCSDAHHFSSNSAQKDRIGNCFTWIKADTTFQGLQHALGEFDERIYVGFEPPLLRRVRERGSRYVDRVDIRPVGGVGGQTAGWFSNEVELNPGLVAVIGNKGSGKSAFAEAVALAGNTRQEDFSFLSPNRFRRTGKGGPAPRFETIVHWGDGTSTAPVRLDQRHDTEQPERVQFIPQNFLETVCNEVPQGAQTDFDKEIERVIFARVDRSEKLGKSTLADLLRAKTGAANEMLGELRSRMGRLNKEIVELERRASGAHRRLTETRLSEVRRQLKDLRRGRPTPVELPPAGGSDPVLTAEIEKVTQELDRLQELQRDAHGELDEVNRALAAIAGFSAALATVRSAVDRVESDHRTGIEALGIDYDAVVNVRIDETSVAEAAARFSARRDARRGELDSEAENGLPARVLAAQQQIQELQQRLDAPAREYGQYLGLFEAWRRARAELIGTAESPETALNLRAQLRALSQVPIELDAARTLRGELAKEIVQALLRIVAEARALYRPVQEEVDRRPVPGEVALRFDAGLVDTGFAPELLRLLDKRVATSFSVRGAISVADRVTRTDLQDDEQVLALAAEFHDAVRDAGAGEVQRVLLAKDVAAFYDFLFGFTYLTPRYSLRFGDKALHELSPGEKGTLLLMFYLVVDPSTVPLIIDQPEDNLDNQTVYRTLVPCVREARQRRQIILVTHNPNLAVVCDADQVVAASIEKENNNRVHYTTGALENPVINGRVVDILEGTWPAFSNRGQKYHKLPEGASATVG